MMIMPQTVLSDMTSQPPILLPELSSEDICHSIGHFFKLQGKDCDLSYTFCLTKAVLAPYLHNIMKPKGYGR